MSVTHAYVIYKMLFGLAIGFTMTTYTPFLNAIGISVSGIVLVNTWYVGTVLVMELPTGMLADGRSRIWSMRIGALIHVIAGLSYYRADSLMTAISSEMLCGLASAFISGADQAWLIDAMRAEGRNSETDRQRAMATSFAGVASGMLIGGVIGGFVGAVDLRLPWLMMSFTQLLAYLFSMRFMTHDGEPEQRVSELRAFVLSLRSLRLNRSLMWVVGLTLLGVFGMPFNLYWAIYFRFEMSQEVVGLLWVPLYGTMVMIGYLLRLHFFARQKSLLVTAAVGTTGLGLGLSTLMNTLAGKLSLLVAHEAGRGCVDILIDSYVQGKVESAHRATFGSLRSFIRSACFMLVMWIFAAWTSDLETTQENISMIWLVSGMLMTVGASLFWLLRPSR